MRHLHSCFVVTAASILAACGPDGRTSNEYAEGALRIRMEQRGDSLNVLLLESGGETCDSMRLPYPVYRFDCGDLTGDGVPEICVGVVKPTRYWPRGRRLFIYHIFHRRYIRPLWLGSRVGRPLLDFTV